jgi:hypothetical protein
LPPLSSVGQHDLAVFLLQSREFPSWGYEIEQGATSINPEKIDLSNARQQNMRQLDPTDQVNAYLFRIGDDQPLQKLRFDPFADQGEIEIETITVRLAK